MKQKGVPNRTWRPARRSGSPAQPLSVDDRLAAPTTLRRSSRPLHQVEGATGGDRILAQNDDYGNDYIRGLRLDSVPRSTNCGDVQRYELTDRICGTLLKLKSAGANLFFDVACGISIRMLVAAARLGGNPITFVNNVSWPNLYMQAAA